MRNFIFGPRLLLAALLAFLLIGWKAQTAQTQSTGADKPVEQVRKNIQVLKGLPDSQLFLVMNFVGDSLGVHCDYCHVKGAKNPQTGDDTWLWEKDDKREKLVGRDMMRMVLDLNRNKFNREAVVTCYTCHRGSTRPERMAPLPPWDFAKDALQPQPKKVLPAAQEVVAKYLSAVGSHRQDVLSKSFVMRGAVERVERANASGPIEIVFKHPGKARITETNASGVVTRGTNGTTAWFQTAKGVTPITGDRLKPSIASVAIFDPIKIPDSMTRATVDGITRVNDRDTYLVTIDDDATQSTQFFFDVENGLLLRRVKVTHTVLGPLNVQWDFSDYRDVNGLKLPFIIRTSDVAAFDTTVRRFSEIKIDPSLDDSVFDMPRVASRP
jgi:outer membrane lipoprotein-sorting protein